MFKKATVFSINLGVLVTLVLFCQNVMAKGLMQSSNASSSLININNLAMWIRADGYSANNPYSRDQRAIQWGILYPKETPTGLVWVDGFVWGGFVQDGQKPVLRVGGTNWSISGLKPGALAGSDITEDRELSQSHVNRIWRYRPDWQSGDLIYEAFVILASKPGAADMSFEFPQDTLQILVDSLRAAYENDLKEWPWQLGAPFYDYNKNGRMDADEEPGLLDADQVVWFIANDLDPEQTRALYGSPPIGIEMQVTLWAYKNDPDLENTVFRRNRIIYKGTSTTPVWAHIDSMAFSIYSEVDVGSFGDDHAGTDTTLQMVFAYNSVTLDPEYNKYQMSVPAIGYHLLQGPIVRSETPNDQAIFDFTKRSGYRNLPMTGSLINKAGDTIGNPNSGDYIGTLQYYNIMNGFLPRPEHIPQPILNPFTGEAVRVMYTGNPITNTGWLDLLGSNAQMDLTIANFEMAPGDTQEVIFAITAGLGSDRLASLEVMKFFARKAREFAQYGYQQVKTEPEERPQPIPETFHLYPNFPNPFNPETAIRYDLPAKLYVRLLISNIHGQKIKSLVDEVQEAGSYQVVWNGKNEQGQNVASGLYFYQIKLGRFSESKKMLLVK